MVKDHQNRGNISDLNKSLSSLLYSKHAFVLTLVYYCILLLVDLGPHKDKERLLRVIYLSHMPPSLTYISYAPNVTMTHGNVQRWCATVVKYDIIIRNY